MASENAKPLIASAVLISTAALAISGLFASPILADSGQKFDAPGAGSNASITVTKTKNLGNETVSVRWTGFRPSSNDQLQNGGGSFDVNTTNPVRVYQCRGDSSTSPRDVRDCYGAGGFRGAPAAGGQPAVNAVPGFTYEGQTDEYQNLPDGPSNFQDTVTTDNGTGQVNIQVFTKRESPALGCDENSACSLVVIPNYGRPQGATEDQLDAPWAWANRTVIPLSFAPVDPGCSGNALKAAVEGSPVSARALTSWRSASCVQSKNPVGINYTLLDETQSRADVASGATDIGLSTLPIAKGTKVEHPVAYAPIAATGLVVGFQIDDAHGQPVKSLKLNQRLVAKLITASYRVADDPGVAGNPKNLFRDPEFLDLNPGVDWPSGAPGNHPLLLAELSDLTWTLTRWIAADPEASAFIAGADDPWGMHVNTAYKNLKLPIDRFAVLDEKQSDNFEPIQGLDHVAANLSLAQFPGALSSVEDGITIVTKPPRQNPGRREVIGIIDAASAAAFRLETASLRNGAGSYRAPDEDGFRAGLAAMTANADKVTRNVNHSAKNPDIYPLTVVANALVPVDAQGDKKQSILRFLDYAVGQGQVSGTSPGDLPAGYVPLPDSLVKLNRSARAAVVAGVVPAPGSKTESNSGTSGSASSASDTAAAAPAPAGANAVSAEAVAERNLLSPLTDPRVLAWLVPLLVVIGLAAVVGGPTLIYLNQQGKLPSWLQR